MHCNVCNKYRKCTKKVRYYTLKKILKIKNIVMLRSKILKIKYLILLT